LKVLFFDCNQVNLDDMVWYKSLWLGRRRALSRGLRPPAVKTREGQPVRRSNDKVK
jgi:hypothetical protein